MRLLFVGAGTAGSWIIRGEQVAAALGGVATTNPTSKQIESADAVIVVKRLSGSVLNRIRSVGVPWLYDVLDAWPQPAGNAWPREQATEHMRRKIRMMAPAAVIYATARMADDIGLPGRTIYHHHKPKLAPAGIRNHILRVGYEGRAIYLGAWEHALRIECAKIGAEFLVNPLSLSCCDVIVAFRSGAWAGYATKHWKSNVKLANAHALGLPVILNSECGYKETATGAEIFIDSPLALAGAFAEIQSRERRFEISDHLLEGRRSIESAAAEYVCAVKSFCRAA